MTKMFSHDRITEGKEEWLTPRHILDSLGPFDLDPCAPSERPWPTAKEHYSIQNLQDGLLLSWTGRVWLNPPYGPKTEAWMQRMAKHGNGIALIFARTETATWQKWVWPYADSILFLKGRLTFCNRDGSPAQNSAGAPSALVAYGEENTKALTGSRLHGAHVLNVLTIC